MYCILSYSCDNVYMLYLLSIILSFYPTFFIYSSIPSSWMRWIDGLVPGGSGFFLVHLAVFGIIFFLSYSVISKYISLGYMGRSRGLFGIILMTAFAAALGIIGFYSILPGNMLYESPGFVDNFLLKNPYLFIAFIAPLAYLYFD